MSVNLRHASIVRARAEDRQRPGGIGSSGDGWEQRKISR
jgi:hypothetical protein